MSLAIVGQLLKGAIGLDVASIGESAIERAVRERQLACDLTGSDAYVEHVQSSTTELQELIEAVVVPETWFFRDREAFAALARDAAGEWLPEHPDGVFRLLSVPCATGEEPYSMAMALLDSGVPPSRFRVDAVDVSGRVLEHARRGVYGRSSFRGTDLAFRDRYFTPVTRGHQLASVVSRQVDLHHGNLVSPAFLGEGNTYDVIFCRNLLIYFDDATQERAIGRLVTLLAPGGFLFVGASETGAMRNHGLDSAKLPMAFAFRHADESRREPMPSPIANRPAVRVPAGRAPALRRPAWKSTAPARVAERPAAGLVTRLDDVAEAQRLADEGRFAEAESVCEAHLRAQGFSAPAFYLLGLVRDASGNHANAEECYRKALYLDPNHSEALAQLALLMDAQGRQADARVLRNRVRRLEPASKA